MKRPQLYDKIEKAKITTNRRETLINLKDISNRKEVENAEEIERNCKKELKNCIIKYMKSITVLLEDKKGEIRKILNHQDRDGNSALHYAAR